MPLPHEQAVRLLATIAMLLGLLVIGGWLLRVEALIRIVPGLSHMVFDTALCFVLAGLSLHLAGGPAPARRLAWLPAALVLLMAVLTLASMRFGFTTGIELPGLQAWAEDGNPHPGRMSAATTVGWLLLAPALMLLGQPSPRRGSDVIVRGLSGLAFALAAIAVIGYVLRLEPLYGAYPFSRMALHTAFGLGLVSIAPWLAVDRRPVVIVQERQLVGMSLLSLVAVALISGLAGLAVLRTGTEQSSGDRLRVAREWRAGELETVLQHRAEHAAIVTTRAGLVALLRRLAAAPDDAAARREARELIDSFMPYGFSAIALQDAGGRPLVGSGLPLPPDAFALPVHVDGPGTHELLWQDGFALRSRALVREGATTLGSLVAEQRLPALGPAQTAVAELGASADFLLCGRAGGGPLACFPNGGHGAPFRLSGMDADANAGLAGLLDEAAARGRSEVRPARIGGAGSRVAFGPAGRSGLVSAVRVSATDLYAPFRGRLLAGLLLVLGVTAGATWLLRSRIRPLVRELAVAEGHNKFLVDTLVEAVFLFDAEGRVLAFNEAARRLFGRDAADLGERRLDQDWSVEREDGSPWPSAEYPAVRALQTGCIQRDVVMGLRRSDDELRWISATAVPTERLPGREGRGVVVTINDITEQRRAEAHARHLAERFRLLVESVGDYGIFMLDVGGRIMSWNPGAERIKGYPAEEIVGRHFSCFYGDEDRRARKPERELEIAAATGRYAEEGWRLRKDGSRFWAGIVLAAIRDDRGQLVGYSKVTRDLTERRLAEQRLADAHRFQQAMLQSSPYIIIASDLDGRCQVFNAAAERMLWYRAEDVIGCQLALLIHDPQEVAARAAELSRECGETIEPGIEVLVHKARYGFVEEREWQYVRKDGSRFPVNLAVTALRDSEDRISGFLGIAYDITERKRREEYTQHVAHHDFLTGLPNRTLMNDRLAVAIEHARRDRRKVAVLMVDLDHFKRVNDSLGHHIGDQLLTAIAERILGCVRSSDTVARMGGDEFVLILSDLTDDEAPERIAALVIERVSAPLQVGPHELMITPSVGISLFPDDGDDGHLLLKNADTAMYRAKGAGRSGFRQFSREMERAARDRFDLESALRRAQRDGELELHYQPQVCLATGNVVGMEALLRWNDPLRGAVSPADFVPVAEESGLIVPIGEWVLRTACRDAMTIAERTGVALKVAVNLSPRQFRQADLAAMVEQTLRDSGLPASRLELEITEGVLMTHADETVERLQKIRALGVTIAVDDFGVGFSSLSYITRFPIDTLKIDRSFVSQLPDSASDAAVTQAIIALAQSLDVQIVAEGIETLRQLEFLRARHCEVGQGFHFARGRPIGAFSVQGFHFGQAVSLDNFGAGFRAAQEAGRCHGTLIA